MRSSHTQRRDTHTTHTREKRRRKDWNSNGLKPNYLCFAAVTFRDKIIPQNRRFRVREWRKILSVKSKSSHIEMPFHPIKDIELDWIFESGIVEKGLDLTMRPGPRPNSITRKVQVQ
jgi:hypothetical protein